MNKLKAYFEKLFHSHASAEEVAQGFSLGLFLSMTPLFGLHTILAIVLAAAFKKNEIATILGSWVVNPLIMFPVYFFIYKVGHFLSPFSSPDSLKPETLKDFFHLGGNIMIPLWIGGLVVGFLSATLVYYPVKWVYPRLKNRFHLKKTNAL